MKFKVLASAALIGTVGLAASPSLSQIDVNAQLNAQLRQAVCAQQWRRAIQIVDRMRVRAPQLDTQLTSYRRQLQDLAKSRARIQQNWPPQYCTAAAPSSPAPTTQTTPTNTPAITGSASPITGLVAVNEIGGVFRSRRVRGTVVNSTNNPVTNVRITYSIVRTSDADGNPVPQQVIETASTSIRGTIPPGGQVNFEGSVDQRIRGDAKVVSVEWRNTLDNSQGANPPKKPAPQ